MKAPSRASRERELAGQIEDALLHFEIGLRTHNAGLYVDWAYVAYAMAAVLAGWELDTLYTPETLRARGREAS